MEDGVLRLRLRVHRDTCCVGKANKWNWLPMGRCAFHTHQLSWEVSAKKSLAFEDTTSNMLKEINPTALNINQCSL